MLGVDPGTLVGAGVVDDDGHEGLDGGAVLAALDDPLNGGVAVLVIQVDAVVAGLGSLEFLGPAELVAVVAVGGLDDGHDGALDVGVEVEVAGGVGALKGELGHEGDVREHLGVRGSVGGCLNLWASARLA